MGSSPRGGDIGLFFVNRGFRGGRHNHDRTFEAFETAIGEMPEVLECHLISGEFDYLMRVAARDTQDYENLYRERLTLIPSVAQMKTLLCLSTVKEFRGFYLSA